MGISLEKGGTINLNKCIDLSKHTAPLNNLLVGLGWDVNEKFGADYDLDAMAALLNKDKELQNNADFIYFGNQKGRGCYSTGDNLTGEGEGDDEQLVVTLDELPDYVEVISFAVIIYNARARCQKFGHIDNAFIRVVDESTGAELCRYDLGNQFSDEVGVIAGELVKVDGKWQFNAIGQGFRDIDYSRLRDMYKAKGVYDGISRTGDTSAYTPISQVTNESTKKGFFSRLFGR